MTEPHARKIFNERKREGGVFDKLAAGVLRGPRHTALCFRPAASPDARTGPACPPIHPAL